MVTITTTKRLTVLGTHINSTKININVNTIIVIYDSIKVCILQALYIIVLK